MIHIFSQQEIRKYKAPIISRAFLFHIICSIIVFAAPLLVVYRSQGFWIKETSYREQPRVNFKRQAILLLHTSLQQGIWSTFASLNSLHQESLLNPLFGIREVDENMDGIYDRLHVSLDVPLDDDEDVYSVKLLLIFDYWLVIHSIFGMESMGIIDYTSSLPGSTLAAYGDLNIKQKELLGYKGTDTRFSQPIINSFSSLPDDYKLATIVSKYQERNVSTTFENSLYMWEQGRQAGQPFRINATVWYPSQVIAYKPGLWYALKWGWIQYFSVMLVFYIIIDRVKQFVLENHIVACTVQLPVLNCKLNQ